MGVLIPNNDNKFANMFPEVSYLNYYKIRENLKSVSESFFFHQVLLFS